MTSISMSLIRLFSRRVVGLGPIVSMYEVITEDQIVATARKWDFAILPARRFLLPRYAVVACLFITSRHLDSQVPSTSRRAARGRARRFVVPAHEKLSAFLELQAVSHRQLERG
jgi:hypothetical protein